MRRVVLGAGLALAALCAADDAVPMVATWEVGCRERVEYEFSVSAGNLAGARTSGDTSDLGWFQREKYVDDVLEAADGRAVRIRRRYSERVCSASSPSVGSRREQEAARLNPAVANVDLDCLVKGESLSPVGKASRDLKAVLGTRGTRCRWEVLLAPKPVIQTDAWSLSPAQIGLLIPSELMKAPLKGKGTCILHGLDSRKAVVNVILSDVEWKPTKKHTVKLSMANGKFEYSFASGRIEKLELLGTATIAEGKTVLDGMMSLRFSLSLTGKRPAAAK